MTHFEQLHAQAHREAEEQVLYLKNKHDMNPDEIIKLYSGKTMSNTSLEEAIHFIMDFNVTYATKQGIMCG